MKRTNLFRAGALLALGLFPALSFALSPAAAAANADAMLPGISNTSLLLGLLGTSVLLLFCIFAVLAYVTYSLISPLSTAAKVSEEATPFWTWFWDKLNAAKPMSREQDILLNHNYDGIRELDNDLPPWWKYGFYLTIVFACVYLYVYHAGDQAQEVSVEEFYAESAELEAKRAAYLAKAESLIDESSVKALSDKAELLAGSEIYVQNCKACHGGAGEGGVGPNLADEYWLHGGGIKNVFKTIKNGVPEKGMIAWKTKLTPKQMQQVGSFIVSMQGTNPPNAKEPQGEKYTEAQTADAKPQAAPL